MQTHAAKLFEQHRERQLLLEGVGRGLQRIEPQPTIIAKRDVEHASRLVRSSRALPSTHTEESGGA